MRISVRDGSHFGRLADLTKKAHPGVERALNIDIFLPPSLFVPGPFASNLERGIDKFTA